MHQTMANVYVQCASVRRSADTSEERFRNLQVKVLFVVECSGIQVTATIPRVTYTAVADDEREVDWLEDMIDDRESVLFEGGHITSVTVRGKAALLRTVEGERRRLDAEGRALDQRGRGYVNNEDGDAVARTAASTAASVPYTRASIFVGLDGAGVAGG